MAQKKEIKNFVVTCPSCEMFVIIEQINCAIFRHGIFKQSATQIPPHSSKIDCDAFIKNELIYGCGKPFIVTVIDGTPVAGHCEYI
jgi:hypothetical protein